MRGADNRDDRGRDTMEGRENIMVARVRLLVGMAIALIVLTVLVVAANPGATDKDDAALSQAMLSGRSQLEIDTDGLTARVVEQRFQIHMEEMDQQTGEIPYVEIWVLNDPFYPLMGDVGDLRTDDGTLSGKEWQMLGFPDYETDAGTTTTVPVSSSPTSTLPVTTGVTQRVVMVEEIYEIRGILYIDIKVNDVTYDKLKAGSEFADVFVVQEIVDDQKVILLCGDETYELKVNQLRKI
jgi:hypothetical protein